MILRKTDDDYVVRVDLLSNEIIDLGLEGKPSHDLAKAIVHRAHMVSIGLVTVESIYDLVTRYLPPKCVDVIDCSDLKLSLTNVVRRATDMVLIPDKIRNGSQ